MHKFGPFDDYQFVEPIEDMPPAAGVTVTLECCGLVQVTDQTGLFEVDHDCPMPSPVVWVRVSG